MSCADSSSAFVASPGVAVMFRPAKVPRRATVARCGMQRSGATDVADEFRNVLVALADPVQAEKARGYMKNQVAFLGVKAPQRRMAVKPLLNEFADSANTDSVVQLVNALWSYPERELHYTAMDVMKRTETMWTSQSSGDAKKMHDCLVRCSQRLPWWDTIDYLSSQVWGPLCRSYPEVANPTLRNWVDSENVWERRVTILFQLRYGTFTDEDRLFDTIRRRSGDDEFWIQKSIGWALRTYWRSSPANVESFLSEMDGRLSTLALREARKRGKRDG